MFQKPYQKVVFRFQKKQKKITNQELFTCRRGNKGISSGRWVVLWSRKVWNFSPISFCGHKEKCCFWALIQIEGKRREKWRLSASNSQTLFAAHIFCLFEEKECPFCSELCVIPARSTWEESNEAVKKLTCQLQKVVKILDGKERLS